MGTLVKWIVTRGHISKDMEYKSGQRNTILNGGSRCPMNHKQLGWWNRKMVFSASKITNWKPSLGQVDNSAFPSVNAFQ